MKTSIRDGEAYSAASAHLLLGVPGRRGIPAAGTGAAAAGGSRGERGTRRADRRRSTEHRGRGGAGGCGQTAPNPRPAAPRVSLAFCLCVFYFIISLWRRRCCCVRLGKLLRGMPFCSPLGFLLLFQKRCLDFAAPLGAGTGSRRIAGHPRVRTHGVRGGYVRVRGIICSCTAKEFTCFK